MLMKQEQVDAVLRGLVEHLRNVRREEKLELVDDEEERRGRAAAGPLPAFPRDLPYFTEEQGANQVSVLLAEAVPLWLEVHEQNLPVLNHVFQIDVVGAESHHAPDLHWFKESEEEAVLRALDVPPEVP